MWILRLSKRWFRLKNAANLLKLALKKSSNQLPGPCPACGEGDERTLAITPNRNLFYCFSAKSGGDQLALVQHITGLDVQDAAAFLSPHTRAAHDSPVPEQKKAAATKKETAFNPVAFAFQACVHRRGGRAGYQRRGCYEAPNRLYARKGLLSYPQRGRQYQRVCRRTMPPTRRQSVRRCGARPCVSCGLSRPSSRAS